MLAFSAGLFLEWRFLGLKWPDLMRQFRKGLISFVRLETDPEVGLWSMIAGAVAVFSEDDKLWFKPIFTSIAAANH